VVDDSRVARAVLTALLNAAGYPDVCAAGSVGSAFALLGVDTAAPIVLAGHCRGTPTPAAGGGGPPPPAAAPPRAVGDFALILMDITMPEVDGIAAIRQIRATAALRDIPIIVVTGRV